MLLQQKFYILCNYLFIGTFFYEVKGNSFWHVILMWEEGWGSKVAKNVTSLMDDPETADRPIR